MVVLGLVVGLELVVGLGTGVAPSEKEGKASAGVGFIGLTSNAVGTNRVSVLCCISFGGEGEWEGGVACFTGAGISW